MFKLSTIIGSTVLLLASCSSNTTTHTPAPLNADGVFKKFSKGVVMIESESYYKIVFSNGKTAYFNEPNADYLQLDFNEANVAAKAETHYGTGFFVGSKGLIATNFHVVAPLPQLLSDVDDISKRLPSLLLEQRDDEVQLLEHHINDYKERFATDSNFIVTNVPEAIWSTMRQKSTTTTDSTAVAVYDDEPNVLSQTALQHTIDSMVALIQTIEVQARESGSISLVTKALRVTLDASTLNEQTYSAHIHSLTRNKEVDLAIIQLDQTSIPDGAVCIDQFNVSDTTYGRPLKASEIIATTSPLFLLGYNHGPSVAKTTRGIKVQLTKGEATQESDDYRVLYSIPTLPGSSGGPVFDTLGRLVAINYCGLRVSDNFNYGIISQHLDDLLHTAPNLKVPL